MNYLKSYDKETINNNWDIACPIPIVDTNRTLLGKLIRLLYYLPMEMDKKKIKKLIKEVKENKNPALMLNSVLGVEEINWLYEHTKPKHQEGWFREEGKLVYYGPNGERY